MYRMLSLAVSLLLLTPIFARADEPPIPVVPSWSLFASSQANGVDLVGTFIIETFLTKHGEVFAEGIFKAELSTQGANSSSLPPLLQEALRPEGTELRLPITFAVEGCEVTAFELGPVPGMNASFHFTAPEGFTL